MIPLASPRVPYAPCGPPLLVRAGSEATETSLAATQQKLSGGLAGPRRRAGGWRVAASSSGGACTTSWRGRAAATARWEQCCCLILATIQSNSVQLGWVGWVARAVVCFATPTPHVGRGGCGKVHTIKRNLPSTTIGDWGAPFQLNWPPRVRGAGAPWCLPLRPPSGRGRSR